MGQEVKNLLRTQSKYGLMGSSAKTGKKISAGHRSSFSIKLSFGIGHPPPIYQMQCICVGEGSRVPNLQTEFNYLDSFKSYCMYSNCKWPPPWRHPMFIMFNMHVHTCMHACMHVHVYLHGAFHTLTPTHTPIYPPYLPPRG